MQIDLSTELKELAEELVQLCEKGINLDDYYDSLPLVGRARAKGMLLIHKLGAFGAIWSGVFDPSGSVGDDLRLMCGCANEILDAVTKGRLSSIQERISAAVLGDLVEHAEVLLSQKYSLAAAVVLRAVLEERLRKLCEVHNLPIVSSKPTIETFRQALAKAEVMDKVVAKKVDWMAGVGNAAAHNLATFNEADVPDLYKATLDLLDRFRA